MAQPASDTILADHHYVTLILRLTLDRDGRVIQGELVDTTDTFQKWFTGSSGLNQAVEAWLSQQERVKVEAES